MANCTFWAAKFALAEVELAAAAAPVAEATAFTAITDERTDGPLPGMEGDVGVEGLVG